MRGYKVCTEILYVKMDHNMAYLAKLKNKVEMDSVILITYSYKKYKKAKNLKIYQQRLQKVKEEEAEEERIAQNLKMKNTRKKSSNK